MDDAELAAELIARAARDQEFRSRALAGDQSTWEGVRRVDADNTAWLAAVLDERDWPRRSQVGDEAAGAAWLLAQHADHDPQFQQRCLALLIDAVATGEAETVHLAYLTDRVLLAEGRAQLYGTQFWRGPDGRGRMEPRPIDDVERLDDRRRRVGLSPFAEYETLMNEQYG
jgi:hypothetical protein